MKLLTKQIESNFKKYPLYSQDEVEEKVVIAKFFGGCACTWIITEASLEYDVLFPDGTVGQDWCMFGYCDLGLGCPEWGYVYLSQIEELRFPPFGLPAERDRSMDSMHYRVRQDGKPYLRKEVA